MLRLFVKSWLPVLIWMAVIFSFSTDSHSYQHSSRILEPLLRWLFPHLSASGAEAANHVFRKCCHVGEYAILGLLVFRALGMSRNPLPSWSWPRMLGTVLIVFLYASTDEFHQRFVPTRTPMVSDVFIDTAGAMLGLLALWLFQHWRVLKTRR